MKMPVTFWNSGSYDFHNSSWARDTSYAGGKKRLLYYKRSWGLGLGETVAFWLNPKNKYVERAHFFLQVVWPSLWWLWRWVLGVIGRLGIKERSGGQRCSLASPPPTLDSPRLVLCSSLPPVVHRDLHHSNPICEALPKKCGSLHPVAIQCTPYTR